MIIVRECKMKVCKSVFNFHTFILHFYRILLFFIYDICFDKIDFDATIKEIEKKRIHIDWGK